MREVENDLDIQFLALRFLEPDLRDDDLRVDRRNLFLEGPLVESFACYQIDKPTLLLSKFSGPSLDSSRCRMRVAVALLPNVKHDLAEHLKESRFRLEQTRLLDELRF